MEAGLLLEWCNFTSGEEANERHLAQILFDVRDIEVRETIEPPATTGAVKVQPKAGPLACPGLTLLLQRRLQVLARAATITQREDQLLPLAHLFTNRHDSLLGIKANDVAHEVLPSREGLALGVHR